MLKGRGFVLRRRARMVRHGAPWGAGLNRIGWEGTFGDLFGHWSGGWGRAGGALGWAGEWRRSCACIAILCKTGSVLRARDARGRTGFGKAGICWSFGVKIFGFFLRTPL